MGVKPVKPELTEARLQAMQVEASKVWRGEVAPRMSSAQHVLYLIAEVRSLRQQLDGKKDVNIDSVFRSMNELNELFEGNSNVNGYATPSEFGPSAPAEKVRSHWSKLLDRLRKR